MKYNLKCQYCGRDHYINKKWFELKLILFNKIYVKCKRCGKIQSYILISHIVHDTTDKKEKEYNKTVIFEDITKRG